MDDNHTLFYDWYFCLIRLCLLQFVCYFCGCYLLYATFMVVAYCLVLLWMLLIVCYLCGYYVLSVLLWLLPMSVTCVAVTRCRLLLWLLLIVWYLCGCCSLFGTLVPVAYCRVLFVTFAYCLVLVYLLLIVLNFHFAWNFCGCYFLSGIFGTMKYLLQ